MGIACRSHFFTFFCVCLTTTVALFLDFMEASFFSSLIVMIPFRQVILPTVLIIGLTVVLLYKEGFMLQSSVQEQIIHKPFHNGNHSTRTNDMLQLQLQLQPQLQLQLQLQLTMNLSDSDSVLKNTLPEYNHQQDVKHSDANTNATLRAVENNSSTIANITTSNSTTTTNILTIVDSNPQDSVHNESVAILPILLWEKEAMYNLKNGSMECNNPLNVPKTCCPGSFSQGGGVNPEMRIACAQADFSIVETLAQQFVDSWPLDISTMTTTMCDICRILDILRQHNESLTIMGDSMTMQVFDGFLCEIMRRQYILVQQNETKQSRFDRGWGNIKSNETITIHSPYWPQNQVVHIQMIFIYSVPFDTYEETEEINQDGGIL